MISNCLGLHFIDTFPSPYGPVRCLCRIDEPRMGKRSSQTLKRIQFNNQARQGTVQTQ